MHHAIDLRSDTVTRPTPEMRRAMAEAEVGDDVYGEDPTVNRLQEAAARLLGFEASLWVPTGVMGNEIAIRVLTEPGQEVLADDRSHVVQYELAGMAVLSGVMPRAVRTADGILTPEDVRGALKPKAYYRSDLGLLVLENTHNLAGGSVMTVEQTRAVVAECRAAGLAVHLDGARLWNAAVALGVEPRALAEGCDTVMVTLSKGLCAPAGSLLAGSRERVACARRVRKQLGGGMRQVGILAAAGVVALETMIPRLADDHAHAALLADALGRCPGVRVAPVRTNIVVATLASRRTDDVVAALDARDVRASAMDATTLRLVTHRDVSREDCERAAGALAAVLG
ncbi:MAG: threonine aldolase family protein [Acidobacteria bacterium]|nr:threonine aldolase family protein [Acidobacteriota bacterium]